jgi:hypothetical protein
MPRVKKLRWPRTFMWIGGCLVIVVFVTAQVGYVVKYWTEGNSATMNMRYQQQSLLSSALVVFSILDLIVFGILVQTIVKWWRSRRSN